MSESKTPIVPSSPDDPRFEGVVVERAASGGALSAEQVQKACVPLLETDALLTLIPWREITSRLNALLAAHDQKVRERVLEETALLMENFPDHYRMREPENRYRAAAIRALASRAEEKETKP